LGKKDAHKKKWLARFVYAAYRPELGVPGDLCQIAPAVFSLAAGPSFSAFATFVPVIDAQAGTRPGSADRSFRRLSLSITHFPFSIEFPFSVA
jgi:hypothetical protein